MNGSTVRTVPCVRGRVVAKSAVRNVPCVRESRIAFSLSHIHSLTHACVRHVPHSRQRITGRVYLQVRGLSRQTYCPAARASAAGPASTGRYLSEPYAGRCSGE
jgi:hypothetical protein